MAPQASPYLLLASAQRQPGSGNPAGACAPLEQAYLRVDGEPRPDDFVTGPAASSFAALIEGMRNDLGC